MGLADLACAPRTSPSFELGSVQGDRRQRPVSVLAGHVIGKLRDAEVMLAQGKTSAKSCRALSIPITPKESPRQITAAAHGRVSVPLQAESLSRRLAVLRPLRTHHGTDQGQTRIEHMTNSARKIGPIIVPIATQDSPVGLEDFSIWPPDGAPPSARFAPASGTSCSIR